MVEHSVRDAGAAGSSPVIPILNFSTAYGASLSQQKLSECSHLSHEWANSILIPLISKSFYVLKITTQRIINIVYEFAKV